MKTNEIITSEVFLGLLQREDGRLSRVPTNVRDDVTINGVFAKLGEISLENLTFHGMVTIRGFNKPHHLKFLSIENSNFLGGLCVEGVTGGHVSIQSVEAKWVHFWRCNFKSAYFGDIRTDGSLDISGFHLTERIVFYRANFPDLELIHESTSDSIVVPQVKTDDPITAEQFRLMGVPVFMSTKAVRAMLERGEVQKLVAA